MEKPNYIAPEVEVLEIQIEQGFAATGKDPNDFEFGGNFGSSWGN